MTARDWLLLFIALPADEEETVIPIDPLRIMKGMFYFTREAQDLYVFESYHLGPISFQIYDDLRSLSQEGMVAMEDVPWQTWKVYRPTPAGASKAVELQALDPTMTTRLSVIKKKVCSLGFIDLLKQVYSDYPEFADKSIFKFE